MSSCNRPFENLDIGELKLLSPEDLKKTLDLAIPVLFKNGEEIKIVQMAALLPDFSGISKETLIAIRAIVSWKIRGKLYLYEPEAIDSMGAVTQCLAEGKDYWTQELQKALIVQPELEELKTWLMHKKSFFQIAETFDQKEAFESILRKVVESDESLKEIDFWFKNSSKIKDLTEKFITVKKPVEDKAKEIFEERGRLMTIHFWYQNRYLITNVISDLGLSKKEVRDAISISIVENTKRVNDALGFKACIATAMNNLTSSGNNFEFMQYCLIMAKMMEIPVKTDEYQKMADKLLILANTLEGEDLRKTIIKIAYHIYKGLEESFACQARKRIISKYDKVHGNNNWDRAVLKEAGRAIPFNYKRQHWLDF